MLVWDEVEFIECLEVVPTVGEYDVSHHFLVRKDGLSLELTVFQYDGDVLISVYKDGIELPILDMKITDCSGVRRVNDKRREYLEFAPSKCFGSRYDGRSVIPFGVRLTVKPSISVKLF